MAVGLSSRGAGGARFRPAQHFVDSREKSDDGNTLVALDLAGDREELLEQRAERAVDYRAPAACGLEHHGAAVAWMRTARDETFGLEPIG